MSTTRRFSAYSSICLSLLVVMATGCSNLDPRDIVVSRRPFEQLTETTEQYKRKLSPEDRRTLQAFIARAELEASITGTKTDVVGHRLHQVLKLQQEWASEHEAPTGSKIEGLEVEATLEQVDPGLYPTKDLWPNWIVDRFQISLRAQNGTKAPVESIEGFLIAEDGEGNAVAAVATELVVPEETGAVAVGQSQSWTYLLEIDRYAPCESTGERSSKLGAAFRGYLEAHEMQTKHQNELAELEVENRPEAEIEAARSQIIAAAKATKEAADAVREATGHDEPGRIVAGVDGRNYVLPSQPIEICPVKSVDQVLSAEFINGLRLRWVTTETSGGEVRSEGSNEPVEPQAAQPSEAEAAPDAGAAPTPDASVAAAPDSAPPSSPDAGDQNGD